MIVQLDLDVLFSQNLSPTEYVILFEIYHYKQSLRASELDLKHLQELGYIKVLPDKDSGLKELILRQKGIDLFEVEDAEKKWLEFKAKYPRKSGERMLHANQGVCRDKYLRLIRTTGVHEQIIKGLENQQKAKINANLKRTFFPEWSAMEVWLNQKSYLVYLDYKEDEVTERVKGI